MASQEAVRLFASLKEREIFDVKSDLYSIFVATENLERAYIRDLVAADEYLYSTDLVSEWTFRYTQACSKLIGQFKTCLTSLGQSFNVYDFVKEYDVHCPAALHRLVDIGVPATTEHLSAHSHNQLETTRYVAESVQHFITLMDSLKLNLVAVDQIHPLLSDLMQSLNKVPVMSDYEGKGKVREWLISLNQMKATDELNGDQVRQLLFDLEGAYTGFHRCLSNK